MIELLVVISIIGLLASISLASMNSARDKARDQRRISDMVQVSKALELYLDKFGTYPTSQDDACNGGWDSSENGIFIHELTTAGLIAKDVLDPRRNQGCGNYQYARYAPGSYGCDSSRGAFFVLEIMNLDTVPFPAESPASPGWKCPLRDWHDFGEWVTGGFEK